MLLTWVGISFLGSILGAIWPRRWVWQAVTLGQLGFGGIVGWTYLQRAPLEVSTTLSTLGFYQPWWGFPTPQGWSSRYLIGLSFATDGAALLLGLSICLIGVILSLWPHWHFIQPRLQIPALLILQGLVLWTTLSYDLLSFYIGFEAALFPMFYLILSLSPATAEVRRTAIEFLLYTLLGSLPMLAGILYGASEISRIHSVPFSTNFYDWLKNPLPPKVQEWVYAGFVLAFWVKLGLFPLHGWMLSLYQHAPLPVVVLSSAWLTKLGGIGWLRWGLLLPEGHFALAPFLGGAAVLSLTAASLAAYFQKGLRQWLAMGSIAHLSLVPLGLAATSPAGGSGAAWMLPIHTLLVSAHILIIDTLLRRTQTDQISEMGGLASQTPQLTALWTLVALASVGLPGLAQFPAEFLVLLGTYHSYTLKRGVFILALLSVLLSAAYTLPVLRRVLAGPSKALDFSELRPQEFIPLWVLGGLLIGLGFAAGPFLKEIARTVSPLMQAILYQTLGVRL
ncbi:MAG: proton-conducting transporter membrane subunit [Bacteroidia bacterium]